MFQAFCKSRHLSDFPTIYKKLANLRSYFYQKSKKITKCQILYQNTVTYVNIMKYIFTFQFEAEFRRFMIKRNELTTYQEFRQFVNNIHKMNDIQFLISYVDKDGDILPINNDDNYARALSVIEPLLRLILRRKGTSKLLLKEV